MPVQNLLVDNASQATRSTNLTIFTGLPAEEGDEEWWPGYPDINQMYRHPAFTVQRDSIGYVEGGDYVRGSAGPQPGHLRFPDSNNTATFPDAVNLEFTTDFSIVFMVRPKVGTSVEQFIGRYNAPNRHIAFGIASPTMGAMLRVSTTGSDDIIMTFGTLTPDQWNIGAITFDANDGAGNRVGRYWAADSVAGPWTLLYTNTQAGAVTVFGASTAPWMMTSFRGGDIAFISLYNGIGAGGTIGGTEVFRFDGSVDLDTVAFNAATFTASTGQVITLTRSTPSLSIEPARGTVSGTPQTALRYPSGSEVVAEAAAQRGVLYCRPFDYNTIEVFWGIPGKIFDKWAEMALIRSAFGYPETVNDGQVLLRGSQATMFPDGMPENFVFAPIYDTRPPSAAVGPTLTGGRYYYSLFFRVNFEWVRSMTSSALLPRNHHHSDHLWNTLTPYYRWVDDQQRDGDGDLKRFLRVFGFELDTIREYVENWQELYHIDFTPVPLLRRLGQNFGVPFEAGIGEIRYRSLIAELGFLYETRGTRPCLERVCEAVSKYECDVTQTGNLMTLPDDSDFFEGTGNWAGINTAYNPDNILPPDVTVLEPDKVFYRSTKTVSPPTGYGRAVMEIWTDDTDATTDVLLTCGCGIAYDVYQGEDNPLAARYIYPIQVGVLADNDGVYAFSCQIKMEVPYPVGVTILWYDTDGGVMDYVNKSELTPSGPIDTNWKIYQSTGTVPLGAVYAVPAIYLRTRIAGGSDPEKAPSVYVAGAAVYNLGSASRVSSEGPNPYLEMGNPLKRIGQPIATPPVTTPPLPAPYPGYQIGEKK